VLVDVSCCYITKKEDLEPLSGNLDISFNTSAAIRNINALFRTPGIITPGIQSQACLARASADTEKRLSDLANPIYPPLSACSGGNFPSGHFVYSDWDR
jgi:hypothetical protein